MVRNHAARQKTETCGGSNEDPRGCCGGSPVWSRVDRPWGRGKEPCCTPVHPPPPAPCGSSRRTIPMHGPYCSAAPARAPSRALARSTGGMTASGGRLA